MEITVFARSAVKRAITVLIVVVSGASHAYTMCPDGRYYPDGQCLLNPNGSWRTAPSSTLAPNGQYVPDYSGIPQNSQAQDLYNISKSFDPYGSFKLSSFDPYDSMIACRCTISAPLSLIALSLITT